MNDKKIGIIGVGMVGGTLNEYFKERGITSFLYDKGRSLGSIEEINQADIVFIAVPTPYDNGFDLSAVEEACQNLQGNKIIVIKSTVVPGATNQLQEKYPNHKFLFNPEFLTEATAQEDMNHPDRQIVGYTNESQEIAEEIMDLLPQASFKRIMPAKEAEMVKYFSNTWFAVKVIFANQMYDLCQKTGIDYNEIKESALADKRIGKDHLNIFHKDYRGFGGKCLAKDISALIEFADKQGIDLSLHKKAREINQELMKEQGIADPEKPDVRNK